MKKTREKRPAASRQATRQLEDEDLREATGAGVSLGYGKIEWKYAPQKPDGTLDAVATVKPR